MTQAYILTSLSPGFMEQAISGLRSLEDIRKISVTAGEYDLVLWVSAANMDDLFSLANEVQKVTGVTKTITHVVGKEIAL